MTNLITYDYAFKVIEIADLMTTLCERLEMDPDDITRITIRGGTLIVDHWVRAEQIVPTTSTYQWDMSGMKT